MLRLFLLMFYSAYALAGLPNLPTIQDLAAVVEQDSGSSVRIIPQSGSYPFRQQSNIPVQLAGTSAGSAFPASAPQNVFFAPTAAPPLVQQQQLLLDPELALMPQQVGTQMPQVVSLDVSCSKESMIVRMRFDQIFNGLIYSKGFYNNQACRYVPFNSGRDLYEFTVRMDSCGSQFIDQMSSGGQAYLENVIIVQNEEGIQEMWDTSRRVRCLWEGLLEKKVSSALSVDLPDSQIVAFSGDSANVFMDLHLGKGPSAPPVSGLVRIGDTLTMVISVEGDSGFDVQVKDCLAHDGSRSNPVLLTDGRGCVLKKKLMGPWQKARRNADVLAFSYFQAFKFPDTLDIFFECNVELCKNRCDICPQDSADGQVRLRRALPAASSANATGSDVRIGRRLRVLSPEDVSYSEQNRLPSISLTNGKRRAAQEDVCMSMASFVIGLVIILLILVVSCAMTALLCIKVRSIPGIESTYAPSSFHAFSSSASKA